jgi:hypothetical protein
MDFGNYLKVIVKSINLNFFFYKKKEKILEHRNHRLESIVIHKLEEPNDSNV